MYYLYALAFLDPVQYVLNLFRNLKTVMSDPAEKGFISVIDFSKLLSPGA